MAIYHYIPTKTVGDNHQQPWICQKNIPGYPQLYPGIKTPDFLGVALWHRSTKIPSPAGAEHVATPRACR